MGTLLYAEESENIISQVKKNLVFNSFLKNNNPIGIFDSGIGGLTIARAIKRKLPNESLIYFGDTQHLPYGDKSSKSIVFFSEQIINFLRQRNVKL